MKKNKFLLVFISLITFFSCQENDYSYGEIIAPSNINITADVVGADASNPDGDGSGIVNFSVTADNAVSFKYVVNGAEFVSLSGKQKISFSTLGLNTYTVTVVASGTAGITSTKSIQVQVLSTYSAPDDLKAKLFGFDAANPSAASSKTWKIQAAKPGHFGLGPVGGSIPTEWYGAAANEKDGLGMYDDRFTFNSDGTFLHTTNGTIFGRDPHIVNDLGANSTGNINGADIENFVYADYSSTWALIAPGGKETIALTGLGFMGYYTGGNHQYEIFDRGVANEMVIKTTDAASDFDWWFIIVSE